MFSTWICRDRAGFMLGPGTVVDKLIAGYHGSCYFRSLNINQMKPFLLLLLTWLAVQVQAQTIFQKSYGSTGSETHGTYIQQDPDGGYTIIGSTAGITFIKTNSSGDTLWTKVLNAGAVPLTITSASPTSEGGFIITATTDDQATQAVQYQDAVLIKTSATGEIEWMKAYGDGHFDSAVAVHQTTNGDYLVTGSNYSLLQGSPSFLVMGITPNGDTTMVKTYSVGDSNHGMAIRQTPNGYIVCGTETNFGSGSMDMFIVRSDPNVDLDFKRVYGSGSEDWANDIRETPDGGFIITGHSSSYTPYQQLTLLKIDAAGAVQWCKIYKGEFVTVGKKVRVTSDGGFIVAGYRNIAAQTDAILVKTDPMGVAQWSYRYGSVGNDEFMDVIQTADGGYAATGLYGNRTYLVKTDMDGMSGCFETQLAMYDSLVGINSTIGGVSFPLIYAIPPISANELSYAPYIDAMCITTGIDDAITAPSASLYPNPVNADVFTISLPDAFLNGRIGLLDVTGRLLYEQRAGSNIVLAATPLSDGVYFVRLQSANGMVEVLKLIRE
jgi:hypothetical protein